MSESAEDDVPGKPASGPTGRLWPETERSWAVFRWLVITATAWFLLKELAPLLRPLFLAVFLAYVVLPVRLYVTGQARGGAGHLALLAGLGLVIFALGGMAYGNIVDLNSEIPRL